MTGTCPPPPDFSPQIKISTALLGCTVGSVECVRALLGALELLGQLDLFGLLALFGLLVL